MHRINGPEGAPRPLANEGGGRVTGNDTTKRSDVSDDDEDVSHIFCLEDACRPRARRRGMAFADNDDQDVPSFRKIGRLAERATCRRQGSSSIPA